MAVSRSLFPAVPEWTVPASVNGVVIGTPLVGRRRELDPLRGKPFPPGLGPAGSSAAPDVVGRRPPTGFERPVPLTALAGVALSTMDTETGPSAPAEPHGLSDADNGAVETGA